MPMTLPPRQKLISPRRILVFSTGSLGDTLLVVPSIRALRAQFREAELVLLCDIQAGSNFVVAKDILMPTGLIDRTITYVSRAGPLSRWVNLVRRLALLTTLRREGFDCLAYLVEAYKGDRRILRDRLYFRLAGIQRFIGLSGLEMRPVSCGLAIEQVTNRADELLNRLAASGVQVPPAGSGLLDLALRTDEIACFDRWLSTLPADGARRWVAVGPGSKMPAKVWPVERFQALVQRLIDDFDIWPVVFGGAEDAAVGERLVRLWGRGYVAAGALEVRVSAVGLSRSHMYVGNDTGTMHLAAAVGVRCVAVFSSREPPGRWEPYGANHHVFRTTIHCAGCRLIDCVQRGKACLMQISVDEVHKVCKAMLAEEQLDMGGES